MGSMDESQKIRERKKGRGKGVELAPESYHGLTEKIGRRVGKGRTTSKTYQQWHGSHHLPVLLCNIHHGKIQSWAFEKRGRGVSGKL